jgi:hypothetical protein
MKRPALDEFTLVIGFDTEFVRGYHLDTIPDEQNAVLCYSFAVYNPRTGQKASHVFHVAGPHKNRRRDLRAFTAEIITAASHSGLIDSPDRKPPTQMIIALVAHFSRADLPAFRDFAKLKSKFDNIRKTYVSNKKAYVLSGVRIDGVPKKLTLYLFDTLLLAPAGYGGLEQLGESLGLPKLGVPDVVNEKGETVPGIERMDLIRERYPVEFDAYAKRDAEVAVEWFVKVCEFAATWGGHSAPKTLASLAVATLVAMADPALPRVLGRSIRRGGRFGPPLPEVSAIQTLAADAFHGGRNEAYVHGVFNAPATRPFVDLDLRGAYTTALAFQRALNWQAVEHTFDLDRLAQLDEPSAAMVEFEFPAATRFPCLPVFDEENGLVFPLKGETTTIGFELHLARRMGARLIVRVGLRVPWFDAAGSRPFAAFAALVNRTRKSHRKKSPFELAAKECGNSIYGKTAQGVGAMKSTPIIRNVYDTREGRYEQLPPSGITAPLVAAYTSGIPRAALSEILAGLPDDARVLSATTDGLLTDADNEATTRAVSGPICGVFSDLRAFVDPDQSRDVLEVKHRALKVFVPRTRGAFTLELAPPVSGDAPEIATTPICARAGHRFPRRYDESERLAECHEWLRICQARDAATKLDRRYFTSIRKMDETAGDLIDVFVPTALSMDYDYKRAPVPSSVSEAEGMVRFETTPWGSLNDFHAARRDLKRWRNSASSVLKTEADFRRFEAWRTVPKTRSGGLRTPAQHASGSTGFPVIRHAAFRRKERSHSMPSPTL